MGRKSKTRAEYVELAAQNNLLFKADHPPAQTRQDTLWECQVCGRRLTKTYNHVKYDEHPCICRSGLTFDEAEYRALARRLGLEWRGTLLPKNTKDPTLWYSPLTQEEFLAAYRALRYTIAKALRRHVRGA